MIRLDFKQIFYLTLFVTFSDLSLILYLKKKKKKIKEMERVKSGKNSTEGDIL